VQIQLINDFSVINVANPDT